MTQPADHAKQPADQPASGTTSAAGEQVPLFLAHINPDLDEALQNFAALGTVLVALDFDGVLAPIVLDPTTSRVLPASAQAVARLATLPGVDVAVVSGRAAADVVSLAGLPAGTRVVGSHGAEWARATDDGAALEPVELTEAQAALLADLRRETEALAESVEGAWVQTKPAAVVLHTRPADPEQGAALTEATLAGPAVRDGVRTVVGKQVVEMAVVEATKGDALVQLRADVGADAVLYAGDDTTDEDAFAVLDVGAGDVTIKVGPGATGAGYRLTDPDEVSAVLIRLVELREQRRTANAQGPDTLS